MAKGADSNKPSGPLPMIIGLVVVALLGFGGGIGIKLVIPEVPSGNEADAAKATEGELEQPADAHKAEETGDAHGGAAKSSEEDNGEAAAPVDEEPDKLSELSIVPLAPIITNLREPKAVWVRFEGAILLRSNSEVDPKILAAQADHQILSYFRSAELEQIQGSSGLLQITEDLNEVMRTFSNGMVRQVLIASLIVE